MMKWTKNERFPNDKIGIIKDEISEKVKGVGASFEGLATSEPGEDEINESKHRGRVDTTGNQHLRDKVIKGTANESHEMVHGESAIPDKDIVLNHESISEKIASQAKANTSTSEYTPLEIGSLEIEKNSYYSRLFSLTPVLVTNRGCIRVSGKNFDYIQIIQRN